MRDNFEGCFSFSLSLSVCLKQTNNLTLESPRIACRQSAKERETNKQLPLDRQTDKHTLCLLSRYTLICEAL